MKKLIYMHHYSLILHKETNRYASLYLILHEETNRYASLYLILHKEANN